MWQRLFRNWWIPVLLAAPLAIAAYFVDPARWLTPGNINTFTSISATLLGFILAVVAILTALTSTRLVRNMIKVGSWHMLIAELGLSALFLLVALLLGLALIFVNDAWMKEFALAQVVVLVCAMGYLAAACYKVYMVIIRLE